MIIGLIVAVSENNVIGKDNSIPWRLPEDLIRFKELTLNHPIVMGRKTFQSLPENVRPLPNRFSYVLSNTLFFEHDLVRICSSMSEVFKSIEEESVGFKNIDFSVLWVIGGFSVYEKFLPLANFLEITRVKKFISNGTVFFPKIDLSEWRLVKKQDFSDYCFETYERI